MPRDRARCPSQASRSVEVIQRGSSAPPESPARPSAAGWRCGDRAEPRRGPRPPARRASRPSRRGRGRSGPGPRRRPGRRPFRWLLDHLEDDPAEAEERLAGSARRSRLVADPSQIEAGRLERRDGAIEVGCDRDNVVDRGDAVRVLGRDRRGLSESVVARPSSSVDSTPRKDQPARPVPDASAARRIRVSPMTQTSPSTANPSAAQASGESTTVSSSSVAATRTR